MSWTVGITKKCGKNIRCLPEPVKFQFIALLNELKLNGPIAHRWKNFGKLSGAKSRYHCHIKKGRPTYVAVWEVKDKTIQLMEVTYVGTHEKAPY